MIGKKPPDNPDKAFPSLKIGLVDERTFRKSLRGKTKNRQVKYARMF